MNTDVFRQHNLRPTKTQFETFLKISFIVVFTLFCLGFATANDSYGEC